MLIQTNQVVKYRRILKQQIFLTSNHSLACSQITLASNQTSLKCSVFNNLCRIRKRKLGAKKRMRKRINEHLNSIDEYLKQIGLCYESVNLAPFTFDKKATFDVKH